MWDLDLGTVTDLLGRNMFKTYLAISDPDFLLHFSKICIFSANKTRFKEQTSDDPNELRWPRKILAPPL
jgi:hypothetical protein